MSLEFQKLHIFRELTTDQIDRVKAQMTEKSYQRREMVIWQGDPCESVFFVISGEVEIFKLSPAGREQILDRMAAGRWFNLVPALIVDAKNQANVRTLIESRLLSISRSDFTRLLVEVPAFGLAVNRYFAQRLAHMTNLVESLSLYTVRQRLAQFLISQADAGGSGGTVRWTQSDIANRLGTVRDVLGRALRRMADEGMLRIEREKILLVDREKLQRAADGDE
ncbi:MAG: Crp/Fnr family transcriptional regulator [Chloroflexi bacterium]|nr:Crp/Fnr family transcriptional regulator [Chloroflexota bacterium]